MNPFVLNAVIKNSWIGSGRYYSHSVKPTRVSKPGGTNFSTKIARRYYDPPKTNYDIPLFHYYQIGQLPPFLFKIYELENDAWVRADTIMQHNELMITVVADNGITLTPRDIWLRKTAIDHNFIIAIFQNPNFNYGEITPNLRIEEQNGLVSTEDMQPIPIDTGSRLSASLDVLELTVHFYSNGNYFDGSWRTKNKTGKMLICETANLKNEKEVSTWLSKFSENVSMGWVNGNGLIYTINSARSRAEDFATKELSVFTDHTIERKVFIPLKNSLTYFSDENEKPHQCFRFSLTGIINKDDISAFVGVGDIDSFKGISLEVNPDKGFKQITNIEISFAEIHRLMAKNGFLASAIYSDIHVMFIIRRGGVEQPTPYTSLRLDLLDTLTTEQRNQILFKDIDFPAWSIESLTRSSPNEFMYKKAERLTDNDVLNNYGLSGVTNLVAKNPIVPHQEFHNDKAYQVVLADWAFREELAYRKDKLFLEVLPTGLDGRLLETSYRFANFAGKLHFQNLPTAKCMETHLVKWYTDELTLQPKLSGDVVISEDGLFFGYGCYVSSDMINWDLAIKDLHYVIIQERKKKTILWDKGFLESKGLVGRVVEGGKHVHHITYFNHHNDYKDYAVIDFVKDVDGYYGVYPAQINIWMDGYLLVKDLDYVIKDHRIYIFYVGVNKESKIRIRMAGISPTGKPLEPIQKGYVNNGKIVFGADLRRLRNKQLRINIAGRMYHKSEMGFGDNGKVIEDVSPGEPYVVEEIYPCIENYMDASTIDEWNKEKAFENEVVSFMQNIDPLPSIPSSNEAGRPGLSRKRKVISGLINYLVYNFLVTPGFLKNEIKTSYNKQMTDVWLAEILHLVDVDITKQSMYNEDNVIVLPHRSAFVLLSSNQFRFIEFVNNTYLNGRVTITGYILVS